MNRLLPALFFALTFTGCDLLGPEDARTPAVTGVFVANQGNFSDGNGSVSTYDPETGAASPEALGNLGTLAQSLLVHDGTLYIAANTAGRVDAYDARTLAKKASYTGLLAPRYMAVAGARLFVTNLYGDPATFSGGTVSIVDLRTGQKLKDVAVGDNPEGIVAVGNRVYVANSGFGLGSTVSVLDAATGEVTATLPVGCDGPRSLAVDGESEVWVVCTGRTTYDAQGNVTGFTSGAVRVLDGATGEERARLTLESQRIGAAALGQDVFFSPAADELYVVAGAVNAPEEGRQVLRFNTRTNALVARINLPAGTAPIGAVAYDARREQLYLGRVAGYTVAGEVTIHNREGTLLSRFQAGIVPTAIAFREGE